VALVADPLVQQVIGHAIKVHRNLGPGLFESVYERCLVYELECHLLRFERQVPLPLVYGGVRITCAYRADLIIEGRLLVELKSIERLLPLHHTQVLTYLKLSRVRQALLINFNVGRLTDGIKSFLGRHEDREVAEEHEEGLPSV